MNARKGQSVLFGRRAATECRPYNDKGIYAPVTPGDLRIDNDRGINYFGKHSHTEIEPRAATGTTAAAGSRTCVNAAHRNARSASSAFVRWSGEGSR